MQLNNRELALVLCGLRLLQQTWDQCAGDLPADLDDILSGGPAPDDVAVGEEVDALCERLNTSGDPWHLFLVEDGEQQRLISAQSSSEGKAEEMVTQSAIDEHGYDAEFTGATYLGVVSGPYEGDVDEALSA